MRKSDCSGAPSMVGRGGVAEKKLDRFSKRSVTLEPHICRHCFGRLASLPGESSTTYACTNCGAEAEGHDPSVLCCCGIKLRETKPDGKPGEPKVDAGLRCHANDNRSVEFPALFVASVGGQRGD